MKPLGADDARVCLEGRIGSKDVLPRFYAVKSRFQVRIGAHKLKPVVGREGRCSPSW